MTSRVRAVLLGSGGGGALVGTLLLAVTGLALMFSGVFDFLGVAGGPRTLSCAEWLGSRSRANWVVLSGCRLELDQAAAKGFPSWRGLSDGGEPLGLSSSKPSALELPLGVAGREPTATVRGVVVTRNPALIRQALALSQRPTVDAHGPDAGVTPELAALLTPESLKGAVVTGGPVPVLEQDVLPVSPTSLCNVSLGFALLIAALWPMARRIQLQRELDAQREPPPAG